MEGILTKLDDTDLMNYLLKFDIVCLVETFVEYLENDYLKRYFEVYLAKAHKLSLRGRRSGGVICLVSRHISKWIKQVNCNFENIIALKIDKQLIGTNFDAILVCVYVHPVGSPYYSDKEENNGVLHLENCLLHLSVVFPECSMIVCGDLNARTGKLNVGNDDVTDVRNDVLSCRMSQDDVINEFGQTLLAVCLGHELIIGNGCIPGETGGNFTNMSTRGNSVIDYFLVSKELLALCSNLNVSENILTSHLCLELTMTFNSEVNVNSKEDKVIGYKFIWDPAFAEQFQRDLNELFDEFKTNTLPTQDIERMTDGILDCYVKAGEPLKRRIVYGMRLRQAQPWFDSDCRTFKRKLQSLLRKSI